MSLSIGIKTDYSLLQSLIKIPNLIKYVLDNNYDTIGILDDNLFSSIAFYEQCKKNGIKPVIDIFAFTNKFPHLPRK